MRRSCTDRPRSTIRDLEQIFHDEFQSCTLEKVERELDLFNSLIGLLVSRYRRAWRMLGRSGTTRWHLPSTGFCVTNWRN